MKHALTMLAALCALSAGTLGETVIRVSPDGLFSTPQAARDEVRRLKALNDGRVPDGEYALSDALEYDRSSVAMGTETCLSGAGWTCDGAPVAVPHTWNAVDGADGLDVPPKQPGHNSVSSQSYARGARTYRRALPDAPPPGRRRPSNSALSPGSAPSTFLCCLSYRVSFPRFAVPRPLRMGACVWA